jgi:hypothetical protein
MTSAVPAGGAKRHRKPIEYDTFTLRNQTQAMMFNIWAGRLLLLTPAGIVSNLSFRIIKNKYFYY